MACSSTIFTYYDTYDRSVLYMSHQLMSANLPEAQKPKSVRTQEQHLFHTKSQCVSYRDACQLSEQNLRQLVSTSSFSLFSRHPACPTHGCIHYSYDYAQQIHYPSNPLQLGPISFKT